MSVQLKRLLPLACLLVCRMTLYAQAPVTLGPYVYDGAPNVTQIGADRFTYDGMGRLVYGTARIAGNDNVQQFEYDGFGNLKKVTTANAPTLYIGVDSGNNRLRDTAQTPPGPGTYVWGGAYDDSGNQRQLNGGAYAYEYDPLDMMVELNGNGRRELYLYDADDERVATVDYHGAEAATWHYTVRGLDGRVLRVFAEGEWQRDYLYRGGQLLASVTPDAVTHYHLDHLGTPVLLTNGSGQKIGEHKYWPYGLDAPGSTADAEVMKFTGHERDADGSVNALDYMHARYYSALLGRFLSVDRARSTGDPQRPGSWNRYVYGSASPLNRLDFDGLEDILIFTTERHPGQREHPWLKAAQYQVAQYRKELAGKYATLNIYVIDVDRVSQINKRLTNHRKIVRVALIGHATEKLVAVGSHALPDTNIARGGGNSVDPSSLNWSNLTKDAKIDILGCHAGDGDHPVAQDIADAAHVPVKAPEAYLNFDEDTGEPFIRWWRFGGWETFQPNAVPPINEKRTH